jgi:hypothetical protein
MRGQLSVSFAIRTVLGFVLVVALAYSVLAIEDTLKKDAQRQTLTGVADLVAGEVFDSLNYLAVGDTVNKTLRLPVSKDPFAGGYFAGFRSTGGQVYVQVKSTKWPDNIARHPMFLASNKVILDGVDLAPPGFCYKVSRNSTNYVINVTCLA